MKTKLLFVALATTLFFGCSSKKENAASFVKVNGNHFELDGKPYYFLGTNFWYGLNLGSKGQGGNRDRLIRELDRLHAMGVNNLRVMAGTEGPDDEPFRMLPALQTSAGVYNNDVLEGLDFLLDEMRKRNMKAVMCLNNFWNWSGGVGQYLVWSGAADSIPHPPPQPDGDWGRYQNFAASFYSTANAVDLFNKHIEFIVNRKSALSGINYKDDAAIMAWELANEPRGINNIAAYLGWIDQTAALIKKLDPNHLVTTGSEGATGSPQYSGTDFLKDHSSKNIDYTTIHIWVQNWNIYNPAKADSTLQPSIQYALNYLHEHVAMANKLNKPVVLEEFGISRDLNNHAPNAPVSIRDEYYAKLFEGVLNTAKATNSPLAGCNFWAWAGEGRPRVPEGLWKLNDDFIGDPPHESQGWYSVYDTDSTTIKIIKEYAYKFQGIGNN